MNSYNVLLLLINFVISIRIFIHVMCIIGVANVTFHAP